ncbi:pyrroloquinoline quinone biosynthesis protein PqqF [Erwinia pyrifoliae]|uniref:Coenzyme PQQ synthesis protein F n=1 Tax=Erwinia pyrifoliae TaxID=79967 RepID=A0ABY5X6W0_ERWPY|nr:pyrroloquinoline quinone biosynthesis protein PqqF [Erwinia pyrifoliae]UWS32952.1 pyrroloquinoline quinone biosynthesis protein PqqF [Erwinia pyrifoliae]
MQPQRQRLDNGLRVVLMSDAQAVHASALLQVDVGSHHEPDSWPGLAHLLEHLLFAGSGAYEDDERLMAWLPAQGGRLNATTLGSSTAFFFECAAGLLAPGLARLSDMLLAPLLAENAIRQEVATIDAECRLLAGQQDTLCDAAQSLAFAAHPWQRFHIGNAASFTKDWSALRLALRQFHQRYYHAANITLWLQGPQSPEALWQLARQYGSAFSAGGVQPPALPLLRYASQPDFALQLAGSPRLRLSFLLDRPRSGELTLLRQLWLDEAAGGLMATLRARNLCDGARLLLPYHSALQTLVSFEMVLVDESQAAEVEGWLRHWLQRLATLTAQQRQHYMRLADLQFAMLSPMDQLRERAFGFAPAHVRQDDWLGFCARLSAARLTRLWIGTQPLAPQCSVQGFSLHCAAQTRAPVTALIPAEALAFFCESQPDAQLALPDGQVALNHQRAGKGRAALLLSPLDDLHAPWGVIMQSRLRALAADCAHKGGDLSISCQQGHWLIQLSGSPALMVRTLASLTHQLCEISPVMMDQGEREYQRQQQALREGIAVRALIDALPALLRSSHYQPAGQRLPRLAWQAVLDGGDNALCQSLSQLLSAFPGSINPPHWARSEPLAPQPEYQVATTSHDATLLRFCPLVENSAQCLAAWQLLAIIYQPAFFQRLRVEQNIGYVVSCRFYQAAGRSGLLFALQSPHLNTGELSAHIDRFLVGMNDELAAVSMETVGEKGAALLAQQRLAASDFQQECRQRWLAAQQRAPQPDKGVLQGLTPERLSDYHQRLLSDRQNAWTLVGTTANRC